MRKNQTSMTAIGIAIMRGIESEKPEGERLCYDPFARKFVNGALYNLIRFFDKMGYSEKKGPGVMGFLAVRERHIDEFLKAQLQAGAEQVVILGAGLDARAYRFDELKKIRVFEVDHPASQASKMEKVKQVLGELPAHVTYVPIDFNSQTLEKRLPESGYDDSRKTLFIWQGVTQYLTPEAVDSTLAFIAQSFPRRQFGHLRLHVPDSTGRHSQARRSRQHAFPPLGKRRNARLRNPRRHGNGISSKSAALLMCRMPTINSCMTPIFTD